MGSTQTAIAIIIGVPVGILAVYILARVAGLGVMRSIRDFQRKE